MKIIIIGGTGTIGKAVKEELKPRHEVLTAGFSSGDLQVDLTDRDSISRMYRSVEDLDAVVLTTGKVTFKPLEEMTLEDYAVGLENKLLGQVHVVLAGLDYLRDGGSFTLTTGILNRDPIVSGSSAAMVNGGLEGFVKSAAIEMPRGIRINAVSPTVISSRSKVLAAMFRGFEPVPAARAAKAYSKSVEGAQTGQVYCVGF